MKNSEFTIAIDAAPKTIWEIMLGPETYQEWVAAAWPGSFYEGEWTPGANIRFVSKDGSGTLGMVTKYQPYETIIVEHIAVLNPGGIEDRESDIAKTWIGTTERYSFIKTATGTRLLITLTIYPAWAAMFEEAWPKALAKLKELASGH